jgi:hypothetical protein
VTGTYSEISQITFDDVRNANTYGATATSSSALLSKNRRCECATTIQLVAPRPNRVARPTSTRLPAPAAPQRRYGAGLRANSDHVTATAAVEYVAGELTGRRQDGVR